MIIIIIIMNTKPEMDILSAYLARNGLRMTRQRQTILREFLGREGHSSAEELTAAVKEKDKSIGQATVYRVLRVLIESGIAREVRFGNGVIRYEHNLGHKHHDHLSCEGCGKAIEVFDETIEELQRKLAEKHHFSVTGHVMNIYGLCEECRESDPRGRSIGKQQRRVKGKR
jgi:Fur family ferric uptake transcriptional regulator